jgi:glutamate synthase domain-containing protein 1
MSGKIVSPWLNVSAPGATDRQTSSNGVLPMCGIVGLFLKDRSLEPQLGALLTDMLVTMTDRGPDSAGIAIYGGRRQGRPS